MSRSARLSSHARKPASSGLSLYPVRAEAKEAPSPDEEEAAIRRAVAFLGRVPWQMKKIRSLFALRERMLEAALRTAAAPAGLRTGGAGGRAGDARAEAVAGAADLDLEIERKQKELYLLREEIWELLALLEDPEAALLLDDHYLSGMSMRKAALRAGYEEHYAYRIRRQALLRLGRLLETHTPRP